MSAPITHRIADKAPEFPCWIFEQGEGAWFRWAFPLPYMEPDLTHWCHSAERPTHAPEAPAQGPSDSEMLDWLENNGGAISRDNFGKPHVGNGLMLHWKTGDTLRAAIAAAMNGGGK